MRCVGDKSNVISRHLLTVAFLTNWPRWMESGSESYDYRVSQILTGQGCFVKYLHRIYSEFSPCVECEVGGVSALQNLLECVAFDAQLCELRDIVGRTLILPIMIGAIAGIFEKGLAMIKYSENVMEIK